MACSRRSKRWGSRPRLSAAFSRRARSSGVITPSASASANSSSYCVSSGPRPKPPETSPATKPAPCSNPSPSLPSLMLDTSVRMSTFLPFRRAVKAHAESLGVCALITLGPLAPLGPLAALEASCVSRGVEHPAEGPKTGPLGDATHSELAPPALGVDAGTPRTDAPGEPKSLRAEALHTAPELGFEEPYPVDARPRAASPVQAAADDEELARWNVGGTADPSYP